MLSYDWIPDHLWFFYMGWLESLIVLIFSAALMLSVLMIRLRYKHDQQAVRQTDLKTRWSQVLPAVLNGEQTCIALWQLVPPKQELFFLEFLYHYAGSKSAGHLNQSQPILIQLAKPYLANVFKQIHKQTHKQNRNPELYAHLLNILGKLAPETEQSIFQTALYDPSSQVAFAAMRALVKQNAPGCGQLISQVLHRFDRYNPEYVASLLSQMSAESGLQAFVQLALNPEASIWSRTVALCTIEHWPAAPESISELQTIGQDTQQAPPLRALILRVLAAWQAHPAAKHLIYSFASSDEAILRAHAMYAIGKLNLHSEHELLELGLHDPARWVAIEAAASSEYLHAEGKGDWQSRWFLQSVELAA